MTIGLIVWLCVLVIFVLAGIRIVRPVERGLLERFGKYTKLLQPGLNWVIPIVDRVVYVNITERMIDVPPQTVITKDKLNAEVDAIVYYQIRNNEKDIKASEYNVDNHAEQLSKLARTTLRAVVGKMSLTEANEKRVEINTEIEKVLDKETDSYGVEVLRVELQKIKPPQDVQEAMNKVVKAEQEKISAKDLAQAVETKADGERRARIMVAEGQKKALVLEAEGRAESIEKIALAKAKEIKEVNEAVQKYFKEEAQVYKKLETTERALKKGTKWVVDSKGGLTTVLTEASGVTPIPVEKA